MRFINLRVHKDLVRASCAQFIRVSLIVFKLFVWLAAPTKQIGGTPLAMDFWRSLASAKIIHLRLRMPCVARMACATRIACKPLKQLGKKAGGQGRPPAAR